MVCLLCCPNIISRSVVSPDSVQPGLLSQKPPIAASFSFLNLPCMALTSFGDGHLLTNICLCRRLERRRRNPRRRGVLAGYACSETCLRRPIAPQITFIKLNYCETQLPRPKTVEKKLSLGGAVSVVCAHFTPSPTRGRAYWTHMLATLWTLFDFICSLVALGGRPLKQSESPRRTPRSLWMAPRGTCTYHIGPNACF